MNSGRSPNLGLGVILVPVLRPRNPIESREFEDDDEEDETKPRLFERPQQEVGRKTS